MEANRFRGRRRPSRPSLGGFTAFSSSLNRRSSVARPLRCEPLESRIVLAAECSLGNCTTVEMLPEFDSFGSHIETVQAFEIEGVDEPYVMYAIYDTGASVVTVSANDQLLYELLGGSGIPAKEGAAPAVADAIGGTIVGEVSVPGTVMADGMHAVSVTEGGLDVQIDFSQAARATGVQLMLGTQEGSESLPNITGVPVHSPSLTHPGGVAAHIDMTAYELDLGALFPDFQELRGIVIEMPDLRFVDSGFRLERTVENETEPMRLPIALWGDDNHLDPGNQITSTPNPVQEQVRLQNDEHVIENQSFLFDTGAQLSVISTEIAVGLGINPLQPERTITVQGADGTPIDVPGFTIDSLEIPYDNDGDGVTEGALHLVNVPIFVLDVIAGLDGILGINLFNSAKSVVYDPFDPWGASVQVSFRTDHVPEDLSELDGLIGELAELVPGLGGALPGQDLPNFGIIPETLVGRLRNPFPSATTSVDSGYVDVHWTAPGATSFGIAAQTIDAGDVLVVNDGRLLSIDRVQSMGNDVWRYYYGDDGETLRDGDVRVTFVGGEVMDNLGNLSTEDSTTFRFDGTSPVVTGVSLNAGRQDPDDLPGMAQPTSWQQQRSQMTGVTVTFSEPVQLDAADVRLVNLGVDAPADDDLTVALRDDQVVVDGNRLVIEFDAGQLADGVYGLTLSADSASDAAGNRLDGNADGLGGDDFVHVGGPENGFFQLTSDFNGDGGVSIFDFGTFAYWFGRPIPDAPAYVDLNDDAGVGIHDFQRFSQVFGSSITFPAPLRTDGETAPGAWQVLVDDAGDDQASSDDVRPRTVERVLADFPPPRIVVDPPPERSAGRDEPDAAAVDHLLSLEDWIEGGGLRLEA